MLYLLFVVVKTRFFEPIYLMLPSSTNADKLLQLQQQSSTKSAHKKKIRKICKLRVLKNQLICAKSKSGAQTYPYSSPQIFLGPYIKLFLDKHGEHVSFIVYAISFANEIPLSQFTLHMNNKTTFKFQCITKLVLSLQHN